MFIKLEINILVLRTISDSQCLRARQYTSFFNPEYVRAATNHKSSRFEVSFAGVWVYEAQPLEASPAQVGIQIFE